VEAPVQEHVSYLSFFRPILVSITFFSDGIDANIGLRHIQWDTGIAASLAILKAMTKSR